MSDNYYNPHYSIPDDQYVFYNTPSDAYYIPPPHTRHDPQPALSPTDGYIRDAHYDHSTAPQGWSPSYVDTTPSVAQDGQSQLGQPVHPAALEHADHQPSSLGDFHSPPVAPSQNYSNHLYSRVPPSAVPALEAPRAVYPVQAMLQEVYPVPQFNDLPDGQASCYFDSQSVQSCAYPDHSSCALAPSDDPHYHHQDTQAFECQSYPFTNSDTLPQNAYSQVYSPQATSGPNESIPVMQQAAYPDNNHYHIPPPLTHHHNYDQGPVPTHIPQVQASSTSSLSQWANVSPSIAHAPIVPSQTRDAVAAPSGQEFSLHSPHLASAQEIAQQEAYSYSEYQQASLQPQQYPNASDLLPSQANPGADGVAHPEFPLGSRHSILYGNGIPPRSPADFEIVPRPSEIVRSSSHVRQAAKLHVDVGKADINSPTSHEARLQQRRRRSSAAPLAFSPYERSRDRRASSSGLSQHQLDNDPTPSLTDSSGPSPPAMSPLSPPGAQHTFIYNPYQHPHVVTLPDHKPATFPPPQIIHHAPCGTAVAVGGGAPAQHQTIKFSDESPTTIDFGGKGKTVDRSTIDPATGEKKPFLACGFCRQRKIACGQRPPHPRDHELPDGPRTCNQCLRRHILCLYPTESRRGLRKGKPSRRIVYRDGEEITIIDEEDDDDEPDNNCATGSKRKKRGQGPMEWVPAVDAWLVTPVAWAAYLAARPELRHAREAASAANPSQSRRPISRPVVSETIHKELQQFFYRPVDTEYQIQVLGNLLSRTTPLLASRASLYLFVGRFRIVPKIY
ncbi:hypothetical protein FRB99_005105 [Tulasnella sp. 403]|nr:hypothetical protein FRB99_005105 [Tulasnella sp. 403]